MISSQPPAGGPKNPPDKNSNLNSQQKKEASAKRPRPKVLGYGGKTESAILALGGMPGKHRL